MLAQLYITNPNMKKVLKKSAGYTALKQVNVNLLLLGYRQWLRCGGGQQGPQGNLHAHGAAFTSTRCVNSLVWA